MERLTIVPPLVITDANLTSSNVAETDFPAWNAATNYAIGDQVIKTTPNIHKIYKRIVAGVSATSPELDAVNWLEVSATNKWKMFDALNNTQTVNAGSIVVSITPGKVTNSVALLNIVANSVEIKMTDPLEGGVYDKIINLNDNGTI